jgi:hypothetical protein
LEIEYFGCCRKSFTLGKKERDLRFGCCSRLSDLGIVEKSFKFERGKRERERERFENFWVFVGCYRKKLANLGICKMSIDHSNWQ